MTEKRKNFMGGLILIVIGLMFLVGQFVKLDNLGLLFLPGLGGLFLLWGILTRQSGLMIPGGIISGIGWGAYAISGPLSLPQSMDEGGVFMVIFGLGFASITLFSALFSEETHWWALIPAAVMAIIGAAILFGGVFTEILALVGQFWPVVLILIGIYVIIQANREKIPEEKLIE